MRVHEDQEDQRGESEVKCLGGVIVKKKDMESHKEEDCKMQPVPCQYCRVENIATWKSTSTNAMARDGGAQVNESHPEDLVRSGFQC